MCLNCFQIYSIQLSSFFHRDSSLDCTKNVRGLSQSGRGRKFFARATEYWATQPSTTSYAYDVCGLVPSKFRLLPGESTVCINACTSGCLPLTIDWSYGLAGDMLHILLHVHACM